MTTNWISRPGALLIDGAERDKAPYFRRIFAVNEGWRTAVVRICCVGFYELLLNGEKVGDHVLDPPVTDFSRRLRYVTYDVSAMLRPGDNVIGVILGNGWYNSPWNLWRSYPRMVVQLELDGVLILHSDSSWQTATGPITFNGIRNGEFYDARLEQQNWQGVDFDANGWQAAEKVLPPGGIVEELTMPPCKVMDTLSPLVQYHPPSGGCVYDFGENIAGWCRLTVCGSRGTVVTLRYAERLTSDHDIDQAHIGIFIPSGEIQTDRYTLRGDGMEIWEPRFTYHGFQYCKVAFEGEAEVLQLKARVVYTAFASLGKFTSANETLNKLQDCFRRSYVGNFVGIPTDCPHREKCGWTGDALLAAESGLFNYASASAYSQWLDNFPDVQRPNGQMHGVIPYCEGGLAWESGPPWDAALVMLPWFIYLYTGDLLPARRLYSAMKRYLDFCSAMADGHIVEFGLDDWCHPRSPNEHPWKERHAPFKAPLAMLATAWYYTACQTFAKIASLFGNSDDQRQYGFLADEIRTAFNRKFYCGDGIYANGCQSALGCALYHELAEPGVVPQIARRLYETVRDNGYKVDFGIVGSKYVLRALADNGYVDAAYRMLTQPECPGYAHWLSLGATSLFEQWDGSKSRNHVCFGDFSAWMFRYLAGFRHLPESPGWQRLEIRPSPVEGLSFVDAEYRGYKVRTELREGVFTVTVSIPKGCSARIVMPDGATEERQNGERLLVCQTEKHHTKNKDNSFGHHDSFERNAI